MTDALNDTSQPLRQQSCKKVGVRPKTVFSDAVQG